MNKVTVKAKTENRAVTFGERTLAALSAGGLGAILGNPADLALIRMQSDGMRPLAERKNYSSVLNALRRISAEEGIKALWNGCLPTVARAMALNFGQLAFYSESKARLAHYDFEKVLGSKKNAEIGRGIAASAVAGFFASFFSLPFDFVCVPSFLLTFLVLTIAFLFSSRSRLGCRNKRRAPMESCRIREPLTAP